MAQQKLKIFIDFDGTLIDVRPRHYAVYEEVVKNVFGGLPIPISSYWTQKKQKVAWEDILLQSRINPEMKEAFLREFIKRIENFDYLKMDTLHEGALTALKKLSTECQCYLVSLRRVHASLIREIEYLGLKKYFTKILTGHSEHDGSDVKTRLITSELRNDTGMIIGDTEADILTGKRLGLTTIGVLSGIRNKEFLSALEPDYLVESMAEAICLEPFISYSRSTHP